MTVAQTLLEHDDARLTGREVLTYTAKVLFDPDFSIEIFLLGEPAEGARRSPPSSPS